MAGSINEVTDTNFQAEVVESETPVLVDFWAPWCGPCRVVAPILQEIASERDDLRIVKLNTDDNPQTAANYGILAIPTMLLFRNGAEAARIQGAMPKKPLEAKLEPALAAYPLARGAEHRTPHGGPARLAALVVVPAVPAVPAVAVRGDGRL